MPEHICDDRCVIASKLRKLLRYKGSDADILQSDRVDHAARRVAHPRSRRAGHWLSREALDHNSAQAVQIDEVRELDSIAECSARRNNWIFEMNAADADSEVNPRGCSGDTCPLGRTHRLDCNTIELFQHPEDRSFERHLRRRVVRFAKQREQVPTPDPTAPHDPSR